MDSAVCAEMHALHAKKAGVALDIYPKGVYTRKYPDRVFAKGGCIVDCCHKTECCHKTKERSEEEIKKLLNRLSRIEGQIRGIYGMVERGAYCTDILVQSAAVTAAVNAFNKELLANHIRTCVAQDIRDGNDEVIDDLVDTLQKLMK